MKRYRALETTLAAGLMWLSAATLPAQSPTIDAAPSPKPGPSVESLSLGRTPTSISITNGEAVRRLAAPLDALKQWLQGRWPVAANKESREPSDPTQPKQPMLDVYALTKGSKTLELPALELKGRILGATEPTALLGVEGQPHPVMVREGVTLAIPGTKYAGLQLRVMKVDAMGVHLTISRFGQSAAAGQPLILY